MGDIAVGIFQETLEQLIVGSGVRSISKKKCRLRSLRDELKCMPGFLKDTEKKRYEHSEVMNLVRQIKDMVFVAENIVELFVVQAFKALDANHEVHPSLHLGSVIKKIKTLTAEIKNMYDHNMIDIQGVAGQKLEHSVSKSEGTLKMNVDGCYYENNQLAGIGGAIRDSEGNWIYGFYGKSTSSSSLEAEIWAIYRGLCILVEKGLDKVHIQSDSIVAVAYCQEDRIPGHPLKYMIEETRRLLTRTQSSISHIYRQANQTADCLARLGSQQEQDIVVTTSIPIAAREFALADSMESSMAEEKVVVGFKEELDAVIGMLHSKEKGELEIISIIGVAGGGKTTLAREVYEHPWTSGTFAIRAWIDVSQEYDTTKKKNMLIRILESADPGEDEDDENKSDDSSTEDEDYEERSDDKLAEDTFKCLKDKKYLIVMDDIWDTDAWDDIQRSLPKESKGSKVLFTSRRTVQPNGIHFVKPHRVAPLPKDSSWDLLQNKVFGKKSCPGDLVGIGEHIAEKCKGLPLAIVAIAGILTMEEKTVNAWEKVSKRLHSIITENHDGCREILELSYNHLPLHLKACFVYICGFPADSEILVHELVWLWIAEGFVHQSEGGKGLEDIAKDYLNNLIDRNLVMEVKKRSFGGIKACRVHDLLRELCLEKGEEDDFLLQIYGDHTFLPSATTKHRRLFIGSLSFHDFSSRPFSRNLRSFLCLYLQNSTDLSFEPDLLFFVRKFALLRVLCFESFLNCEGKIGRGDLVHLRYLALENKNWNFFVPFSYHFNLETLHFKRRTHSRDKRNIWLPRNIFEMVRLRHLYSKEGIFNYHHICHDHSSKMDNLQTLNSICPCEVCRNFLVRTPSLRKLGFCTTKEYEDSGQSDLMSLDLGFLKCLENLKIDGGFWGSRLPPVLKFPPTVTQLTLKTTWLKWEDLSILQTALPNLEVLKLLSKACLGPTWNTSDQPEWFSHLKYLRLDKLDIEEWIADEDQFPRLEVLVVSGCRGLKGIPIEFASLNELHEIEVRECSPPTEESARDIQKEQRDIRGDDGCINLLLSCNDL